MQEVTAYKHTPECTVWKFMVDQTLISTEWPHTQKTFIICTVHVIRFLSLILYVCWPIKILQCIWYIVLVYQVHQNPHINNVMSTRSACTSIQNVHNKNIIKLLVKPEQNTLKIFLIIPSCTSQKIYPLFFFILISLPIIPIFILFTLLFCILYWHLEEHAWTWCIYILL